MRPSLPIILVASLALAGSAAAQDARGAKLYRIVDGKVDAATYNGYRRFHAGCNHCHGQDGLGSTFGPSLAHQPRDKRNVAAKPVEFGHDYRASELVRSVEG